MRVPGRETPRGTAVLRGVNLGGGNAEKVWRFEIALWFFFVLFCFTETENLVMLPWLAMSSQSSCLCPSGRITGVYHLTPPVR